MRSFKRLLGLGLLVGSAHAGWEGNELNWLAHEASERPPREARSHPPPERGEKIQASGNFVAPRLAGAREAGLMGAVRQGDVKAVRAALDAGVNPNLSEPGRAAPLLVAVRADQADIVLALLERGAFADFKGAGETPLARAVKNGNTILVRALLAAGADPDRRGDDGDTVAGEPVEVEIAAGSSASQIGR